MSAGKIIDQLLFGDVLAPWRDLGADSDVLRDIPSMISFDERCFLYWLARNYYVGAGKIVDLGPLAGSSTRALAMGVLANPAISDTGSIIHSYDLWFFYTAWQKYFPGRELRRGADLLPYFLDNIADGRRIVEPHKGDLICQNWTGEPVEILFVDVVKTTELAYKVARTFFPCLIPGRSIVVQQDFISISEIDVPLTMGVFRDYFEYIDSPEGGTVAFLYTKPVPEEMLEMNFLDTLSMKDKLGIYDAAVARINKNDNYINTLMLAKAACLIRDGWGDDIFQAYGILKTYRRGIDKGEMIDAILSRWEDLFYVKLFNIMLGNQSVVDFFLPDLLKEENVAAVIGQQAFAGKRVVLYGISDVAKIVIPLVSEMAAKSISLCDGYPQKIGSFVLGRQVSSIDCFDPNSYDIMLVCTKSLQSESDIIEYVTERGHSTQKIMKVYSMVKENILRSKIRQCTPHTRDQSRAKEILLDMK